MKTPRIVKTSCALIGCCMSTHVAAHATQTDNYGLHAVPAPPNIAIDGKLGEWDLSGQVLMTYDIESLRDVYSAQVATMYDANNFYVAIHWRDPLPLGNSHDPRYKGGKGWAGDSVLQTRLDARHFTTCVLIGRI